ncbi:kinase-like domain-containing protein [Mycena rosella]|uniref:Kinase-like domain-containing protein n=1 Tax=Mycena rosella TaxID=1033263 RepID=A0AAD7FQQ4_MYCRO|nr:kinase-like domain-containing protein [Mycena rosella]
MSGDPSSPTPDELFSQEYQGRLPASFYAAERAVAENRLGNFELFWRDHSSWLKERGYVLRARYQLDWVPSWKDKVGYFSKFEDNLLPPGGSVLDGIRTSDGQPVIFKLKEPPAPRPDTEWLPDFEKQIIQKFTSEPLTSDPKNHCVRLLEILTVPDVANTELMVLPLLFDWNYPRFTTIGEAVDFLTQIFEGLHFMHSHNVWHGDCKSNNIMMDSGPIQISSVHPLKPSRTREFTGDARYSTRTRNPVKYYWIDFDLSVEHDPTKGPPLTAPGYGGNKNVPEFRFKDRMCDPFAVDVWCLGDLIRKTLTQGSPLYPKRRGLEFLHDLLADMTSEDPVKRPSMGDVVNRFSEIKAGLSQWKLRSRFAREGEKGWFVIFRSTAHWIRQACLVLEHRPAVPSPEPPVPM